MRASVRPPPHWHWAHTNTDHFLGLGKGSYWRILSGKRTFSNKWWWTLDKKPLLTHLYFCLLNLQSAAYLYLLISFFIICVRSWSSVRLIRWGPPHPQRIMSSFAFLTRNESTFRHVWRCWSVCVCLGLVLLCMEAHSCQKRTARFNLAHVSDKEKLTQRQEEQQRKCFLYTK